MRHTVIGIFDTYDQAEVARSALLASGFASGDIELQAAPDPSSPADPSLAPGGMAHSDAGVLGNIERFFSMLFGGRERPPEVEHYSEAVRRGAILVSVETDTEGRADLARETLAQQGAIDIDERAASWGTLNDGVTTARTDERDHSLLDEIGIGSGTAVPGGRPVNPAADPLDPVRAETARSRAYPRTDLNDPAVDPLADPVAPIDQLDPISPVARDVFAGGSDSTYRATGGDPMTSNTARRDTRETFTRYTPEEPVRVDDMYPVSANVYETPKTQADGWRPVTSSDPLDETEASARADATVARSLSQTPPASPAARASTPDEYMEYEDDFRTDYESKYAATGARYEEYEHAYRYGATAGTEERYRNRDWDDAMESDLQRDWQSRTPHGEDTWERFKLAVRHGWDRVTGHHHH